MKKVLFKELRPGQIFWYGGCQYSKLTADLSIDQQKRCTVAKNTPINAIKIDKTEGAWVDSLEEVEIEPR